MINKYSQKIHKATFALHFQEILPEKNAKLGQ